MGLIRALVEVGSVLRPVKTFQAWGKLAFQTGGGKSTVFGERLRERVSAIMEVASLANQVRDARIDTHSLRSGGATALYTQGVPLDVIQRWRRWESLTFHQYMWRDDTALRQLPDEFTRPSGLLKILKLMNTKPKSVSFQHQAVSGANKPEETELPNDMTKLFLPNESFRAGSSNSDALADSIYTATPVGDRSVFFPARDDSRREKNGKAGKELK